MSLSMYTFVSSQTIKIKFKKYLFFVNNVHWRFAYFGNIYHFRGNT